MTAKKTTAGKFRSRFEETVAKQLDALGVGYEYESERLAYYLPVAGGACRDCGGRNVYRRLNYLVDFTLENGVRLEAKGRFTSRDRTKMKAVKEANPDLDIRFVFMRDNYLSRKHKTRYSEWAKRNGFKFYIGEIDKLE